MFVYRWRIRILNRGWDTAYSELLVVSPIFSRRVMGYCFDTGLLHDYHPSHYALHNLVLWLWAYSHCTYMTFHLHYLHLLQLAYCSFTYKTSQLASIRWLHLPIPIHTCIGLALTFPLTESIALTICRVGHDSLVLLSGFCLCLHSPHLYWFLPARWKIQLWVQFRRYETFLSS
jgi:hypothetical protein